MNENCNCKYEKMWDALKTHLNNVAKTDFLFGKVAAQAFFSAMKEIEEKHNE